MNRLERRLAILRGKRQGAFDPDQYHFEHARRTRVARRVRTRLRRLEPVTLVTPRWSQARRFLDDLATDLAVGEPAVACRTLDCAPLRDRTRHQAQAWFVEALTEFCGLTLDGPSWQAVARLGFRTVVRSLLTRADATDTRRCLMLHGAEHIPSEALDDLISAFDEHVRAAGTSRRFNLLVAGRSGLPAFEGQRHDELPDFAEAEAMEVLVEHLGPLEPHRLRSVVALVGGVPAILDALGAEPDHRLTDIVQDRDAVWRAIGRLANEIRSAFTHVASDGGLIRRFERIAREGPVPEEPERDDRLRRAGFVEVDRAVGGRVSQLRAPVFADLALAH